MTHRLITDKTDERFITKTQCPNGRKEKTIMDKFTESEVRTAYLIGIATGHTIDEINTKIIAVTANNRNKAKKMPDGSTKMVPVDGSSKLSIALDTLRNAGYIR